MRSRRLRQSASWKTLGLKAFRMMTSRFCSRTRREAVISLTSNIRRLPEGAATGAATGGVLGGVAGWLVGIGALAIPGLGPFVAAGPIMAALGGAAAGAAAGGLTGALVGLGMPEYEAKRYEGKIKSGGILISVHTDNGDEVTRAKELFKRAGAEDISYTGETKAA